LLVKHPTRGKFYNKLQVLDPNSEEAWLKLDGEPKTGYEYFCLYRDMPRKERSFQKLAFSLSIARQGIQQLAAEWAWKDQGLEEFSCSFSMAKPNYATRPVLVHRLLANAKTVGLPPGHCEIHV
jgi:hypothetical protein